MDLPNSSHIKTALLHYYRFRRQFSLVATEVGGFASDVMAIDTGLNRFIEVEVKVSKSDMLADFKKGKHVDYLEYWKNSSEVGLTKWIPQEFYFAVPSSLMAYATNVIEGLPYGLIEYTHHDPRTRGRIHPWGDRVRIAVQASRMHRFPPSEKVIETIIKRMSSELCIAYQEMMKVTK